PLAFHILVPTTSVLRKQYARLLQEEYRAIGVRVDIDEVENSVVGQRVGTGHYDTAILSRANDPSPSSGVAQTWTRAGFGGSHFGRFANPAVDRLVDRAIAATAPHDHRPLWRLGLDPITARGARRCARSSFDSLDWTGRSTYSTGATCCNCCRATLATRFRCIAPFATRSPKLFLSRCSSPASRC